jgi:hypothetical protein
MACRLQIGFASESQKSDSENDPLNRTPRYFGQDRIRGILEVNNESGDQPFNLAVLVLCGILFPTSATVNQAELSSQAKCRCQSITCLTPAFP